MREKSIKCSQMNYEEWEHSVPDEIANDSLWKMEAYRLGLFAADVGWHAVTKLMRDKRTVEMLNQLYRTLGSISTNLAEGYSRGTGRDRARFYEYALGSAGESRDWYYKGRHILGPAVTTHRLSLLTQIIRLLLTLIPQQRQGIVREAGHTYKMESADSILQNVPFF